MSDLQVQDFFKCFNENSKLSYFGINPEIFSKMIGDNVIVESV